VLCNPSTHNPVVIPGTRLLEDPLGVAGTVVADPREYGRVWTVQWMLAPIKGRRIGGVRAKLVDAKGFVTFCNQRDLEVLLGLGKPGQYCYWLGGRYVSPEDNEWHGLCADDEDLRDDLFEHECRLREAYGKAGHPYLPHGIEVQRRVHLEPHNDFEELYTLLWDMDPDTHHYPDPTLKNVARRWARVQRDRVRWERVL
jgi:hypothetical protein